MTDKEKLYETMGELIYAIAMADGEIQKEEQEAINNILANHRWASNIKWSLDYEKEHHHSVREVYHKVMSYCISHGPSEDYVEFVDVMIRVAEASNGIDEDEMALINEFSFKLSEHFQGDLDKLH